MSWIGLYDRKEGLRSTQMSWMGRLVSQLRFRDSERIFYRRAESSPNNPGKMTLAKRLPLARIRVPSPPTRLYTLVGRTLLAFKNQAQEPPAVASARIDSGVSFSVS